MVKNKTEREIGREEGWSLAQMIVKDPVFANVSEIFGVDCQSAVFDIPFEEALLKASDWEDKHHFVIGDVVIAHTQNDGHFKGVVVNTCQDAAWVLYGCGIVECINHTQLEKTGDYLEEVNDIFKALKEDK